MGELDEMKQKNEQLDENNISLQTQVTTLRKLLLQNGIDIDLKGKTSKMKKDNAMNNEELREVIQTMSQQKYVWEREKNKLTQELHVLSQRLKQCTCVAMDSELQNDEDKVDKVLDTPTSRKRDMSFANHLSDFATNGDLDTLISQMSDDPNPSQSDFAHNLNSFADADVGSLDAVLHDMRSPDLSTKVSIKTDVSLTSEEIEKLEYLEQINVQSTNEIVANIEIDEYENSDDGWVSEEELTTTTMTLPQSMTTLSSKKKTQKLPSTPKHKSSFWRQQSAKEYRIKEIVIPANQLRKQSVINKTGNHGPLIPIRLNDDEKMETAKTMPFKKRQINIAKRVPSRPPPQIIANIKRTKQRRFNPTKHGVLSVQVSNLWKNKQQQQQTFYAAIDGLPSSTNIDKEEPEWKKRKNNDILVPILCFFKSKKDFETLVKFSKHASVRDIAFQTNFAHYCNGFIRLDLAAIHWKINDLVSSLDVSESAMNGLSYQDDDCCLYIASNVDNAQMTFVHSFVCENKQRRNEWLSSLQSLMNKRKDSAHRRNLGGSPHMLACYQSFIIYNYACIDCRVFVPLLTLK